MKRMELIFADLHKNKSAITRQKNIRTYFTKTVQRLNRNTTPLMDERLSVCAGKAG